MNPTVCTLKIKRYERNIVYNISTIMFNLFIFLKTEKIVIHDEYDYKIEGQNQILSSNSLIICYLKLLELNVMYLLHYLLPFF